MQPLIALLREYDEGSMSKEEFNIRLKTLISDYQLEREAVDAFIKYWPKAEEYPQDMWAV